MSNSACRNFHDTVSDSKAIRVLLFGDSQTIDTRQISGCDRNVKVVDTVKTGVEALEKVATLLPDAVIMLADSATPTAEFEHAVCNLGQAQLCDRVLMMVNNPAGYLRLAVKAGAAVLLQKNATPIKLITALREVRASCKHPLASLLQQPSVKSRPQRLN